VGYKFVIGLAPEDPRGEVVPCEGDPMQVHRDWWDNDDGPVRQPSYMDWWDALSDAPRFRQEFEGIQQWARQMGSDWVPCRLYEDTLDALEAEAGAIEQWSAARELWFVRWSRLALELYGDRAAFGAWGEWR
jgi:hypothetical protein